MLQGLMQGWDSQIGLIVLVIAGIVPVLKNLPYIGKYITSQVAVIADLVIGLGASFVRAYYFLDPFYGVPPKLFLILAVGLLSGVLASGGYKTLSDLISKANPNNGK